MTQNQFAQSLGFSDYERLIHASEVIIQEGEVGWYVTKLPSGQWAAWDEWELAEDRVIRFSTRGEAIAFHLGAYVEKCRQEQEEEEEE